MNTQYTFRRTEKKYLLTPDQFASLTAALQDRMIPDSFGRHTIASVYYDTPDFYLIRRSLEHPVFKEKLRLRGYTDTPAVFPEIKQKYKGVVYKRRISCSPEDWQRVCRGETLDGQSAQIQRELQMMFRRYSGLAPAVYIAYDRTAYQMRDGSGLRITFDENLRARTGCLELSVPDGCIPLLDPGLVVMEVKFPGSAPLWLSSMLSARGIYPSSFSKVGRWYTLTWKQRAWPDKAPAVCRRAPTGSRQSQPIERKIFHGYAYDQPA